MRQTPKSFMTSSQRDFSETVSVINSRLDWSCSHQLHSNISTHFSWITEDLQSDNRKEKPYSSTVCRLKCYRHQKDGYSHVFCIHPRSCGLLTSVGTASSLREQLWFVSSYPLQWQGKHHSNSEYRVSSNEMRAKSKETTWFILNGGLG